MKGEGRMKKEKFDFSSWAKAHVAEFKRIIWPSKDELIKETVSVILISLVFGAIIFGFDQIVTVAYNALASLLA